MLKKILAIIALALVAFLIFVATRPDTFRVERSIVINAPPELVFDVLNDMHNSEHWYPWDRLDPNMKKEFHGPEKGVGSSYSWKGNDEVGEGSQKIVKSEKPTHILTELHFIEPFEANNFAEYSLRAEGEKTHLTWGVYGPSPFISKLMGVFMNMDKMLGDDFEKGLASLKTYVESKN